MGESILGPAVISITPLGFFGSEALATLEIRTVNEPGGLLTVLAGDDVKTLKPVARLAVPLVGSAGFYSLALTK